MTSTENTTPGDLPTDERRVLRDALQELLLAYEDRVPQGALDGVAADARAALAAQAIPTDCDVRKIMLDIVPGDGSGFEVFAENVGQVVDKLTELAVRAEEAESKLAQWGYTKADPVRNNPVSALAIRILVESGRVTQADADSAFTVACAAMEDEAEKMNVTLPWVTRKHAPATQAEPVQAQQPDQFIRCEKCTHMNLPAVPKAQQAAQGGEA